MHHQISPDDSRHPSTTSFHYLAAISILVAILLAISTVVPAEGLLQWDFRNNLWGPTHLLINGQSPYRITTLYPDSNAVWFPMAVGVFFPLGWLKLQQASLFWLLGSICVAIILAILAFDRDRPNLTKFAFGLLALFLHPRMIAHLRLGQYTLLCMLFLILATRSAKDGKLLLTSFLIMAALAKPQLGIFVIPGILLVTNQLHGKEALIRLVVYLGLVTLVMLLPLYVMYPSWFEGFMWALKRNSVWLQPSLFSLLPRWWGPTGLFFWLCLTILIVVVNFWLWLKKPTDMAMFWSLALTPLVTPYIWSWDMLMIMPLFLRTAYESKNKRGMSVLAIGYALLWWLMFRVILKTDGSDHHFWWLPWLMLSLILASKLADSDGNIASACAHLLQKKKSSIS